MYMCVRGIDFSSFYDFSIFDFGTALTDVFGFSFYHQLVEQILMVCPGK